MGVMAHPKHLTHPVEQLRRSGHCHLAEVDAEHPPVEEFESRPRQFEGRQWIGPGPGDVIEEAVHLGDSQLPRVPLVVEEYIISDVGDQVGRVRFGRPVVASRHRNLAEQAWGLGSEGVGTDGVVGSCAHDESLGAIPIVDINSHAGNSCQLKT
jgi:hypothetical protein